MYLSLSSKFLPILVKEINYNFRNTELTYLKNILNSFPENNYRELLCSFKEKVHFSINNNHYYKFKIYSNEDYEMNIINWNTYSFSNIHNHCDNGCVMKMLDGVLLEQRYDKDQVLKSNTLLKSPNSYYINNTDLHSIYNLNGGPSYSLHIYSPPDFNTTTFN